MPVTEITEAQLAVVYQAEGFDNYADKAETMFGILSTGNFLNGNGRMYLQGLIDCYEDRKFTDDVITPAEAARWLWRKVIEAIG